MNGSLVSDTHHLLFELCRTGQSDAFRTVLENQWVRLDLNQAVPREIEIENNQFEFDQENGDEIVPAVAMIMGHRIDTLPWRGKTLLTYATERGQMAIVRLLVEYGVDCEAEDCTMTPTPLMAACRSAGLSMVQYFVKHVDCDVNHHTASPYYPPPRNYANGATLSSMTRSHLAQQQQAQGQARFRGDDGETVVNVAVDALDLPLVRYLVLDCHVQLTFSLALTKPILSVFEQKRHLEILQFLLLRCGSMMSETFVQVCLFDACKEGYLPRVQLLLSHYRQLMHESLACLRSIQIEDLAMQDLVKELVFIACAKNHLHILHYLIQQELISNGFDTTPVSRTRLMTIRGMRRQEDGASLLFVASTAAMMQYLIYQQQVDLNVQEEKTGRTALMIAAKEGRIECVKCLIECVGDAMRVPVDVHMMSYLGETALAFACIHGQVSVVDYLLDRCYQCVGENSRLNELCFTEDGVFITHPATQQIGIKTLLMYVIELRAVAIVEHLLVSHLYRNRINLNIQDHEGETALMKAVKYDSPPMVRILLEEGWHCQSRIDMTISDIYGNDVKVYADMEVSALLEEHWQMRCAYEASEVAATSNGGAAGSAFTAMTTSEDLTIHQFEDNAEWIAKRLRRDGYDYNFPYPGTILLQGQPFNPFDVTPEIIVIDDSDDEEKKSADGKSKKNQDG